MEKKNFLSKDIQFNLIFTFILYLFSINFICAEVNDKYTVTPIITPSTMIGLIIILIVLLLGLAFQLRKFTKYDFQITRMISVQKNIDMFWGNLKKKKINSKGSNLIANQYQLKDSDRKKLEDLNLFQEDLNSIKERNTFYCEREFEFETIDNKMVFLKRYTHRINEFSFMALIVDVTAERYKENLLSELANTDDLTGLLNRRAMNKALVETLEHKQKHLYIFMFDIDNFKIVNDTYGHDIGDLILVAASQCFKNVFKNGIISRWGGEEFLVVADLEDLDEAILLANNVLLDFASSEVKVDNKSISTTISCGVAEIEDNEIVDTITRSDKALYQAKTNNKNNVRFLSKEFELNTSLPTYYEDKIIASNHDVIISTSYNRIMAKIIRAFFYIRDSDLLMNELLQVVCDTFGMNRAYYYQRIGDLMLLKYNCEINGYSDIKDKTVPVDKINWKDMSKIGDVRFIEDISLLQNTEEKAYHETNVKSFVQFAIGAEDEIFGVVGFTNEIVRVWSEEDRRIFSDISIIINEIAVRQNVEDKFLSTSESLKMLIDSIDEIVYVVDRSTRKLIYANKKIRDLYNLNENYTEKTCWEILRPDLNGPCDVCMHDYLSCDKKMIRHTLFNNAAKRWFNVTDTIIEWENQDAIVMVCIDITDLKTVEENANIILDELKIEDEITKLAKAAKGFSWILNLFTGEMEFSEELELSIGYRKEEFNTFVDYRKIIPTEYHDSIDIIFDEIKSGKRKYFEIEHPVIDNKGIKHIFSIYGGVVDNQKISGSVIDITHLESHNQMQQILVSNLKRQKEEYHYAIENAQGFSWTANFYERKFVFTSSIEKVLGYDDKMFDGTFDNVAQIIIPQDVQNISDSLNKILDENLDNHSFEIRVLNSKNELIYLSINAKLIDKESTRFVGVGFDVTEQRLLEKEQVKLIDNIKKDQARLEMALSGYNSYTWERQLNSDSIIFDDNFYRIIGYTREEISNNVYDINDIFIDNYYMILEEQMSLFKSGVTNFSVEYPVKFKNGEIHWYLGKGKYVDDNHESVFGVSIDITESKQHAQQLSELAFKDSLTGLYNLQYLSNEAKFDQHEFFENVGAILVDISRFKEINDIYGHEFGNYLLKSIATRINKHPFGDLKARVSGDRFFILKVNTNEEELLEYIGLLNLALKTSKILQNRNAKLDIKLGVVLSTDTDIMKILTETEVALQIAKKNSTSNYCILNDQSIKEYKRKIHSELELNVAIQENQFFLVYQPQIDTISKKVIGAEALIRWRHPELGIIYPGDFISLAEENGLIIQIGEFVIREVVNQLAVWQSKGFDLQISFNLSPKQFVEKNVKELILGLVSEYKIKPNSLVVELTENILISDFLSVNEVLNDLRHHGVLVALDDFGTGYSSISYLNKLAIDILKIDRQFITDAKHSEDDRSILESIILLAHKLKYHVVAEGVETIEELQLLEDYKCDSIQGYYFSKPLELLQFEEFVEKSSPYSSS